MEDMELKDLKIDQAKCDKRLCPCYKSGEGYIYERDEDGLNKHVIECNGSICTVKVPKKDEKDIEFKPGQDITIMGNKFRVVSTFKDWDDDSEDLIEQINHVVLIYFANGSMQRTCLPEYEVVALMDKQPSKPF